jgi:glycosyltransferase involved in cell wall biosynthesis
VRLRIVGSRGGPSAYARHIEHLVSQHAAWISLHVDVPRPVLLDLIARSRYCIHGMREEHFGIAPAEALAGGCIVFVPDGGGQVEIVGDERRLRFGSDADAVEKIVAVMGDPVLQASLRSRLGARAGMFTADRFVSRVRELVEGLPRRAAVRAPAS